MVAGHWRETSGGLLVGPNGPLLDPASKHFLAAAGKRALGGHPQVGVGTHDAHQQGAFIRLARHDRHAVFSTPQGVVAPVEAKVALLLLGAMTSQAMLGKDRLHVSLKIDRAGRAPRLASRSPARPTRHQAAHNQR